MPGVLRAGVVLILAALAGCAAQPEAQPGGIARRLSFPGYSVVPPLGAGWSRVDPPGADAGFSRDLGSAEHRFLLVAATRPVSASFRTPREFLDYVIAQQENEADPRRFHVLQEGTSLDSRAGSFCVRTSASAEDRRTRLVLDATTLACLHPTKPRLMITVGWSELHRAGGGTPALTEEGGRFIDSLRLFDLQ